MLSSLAPGTKVLADKEPSSSDTNTTTTFVVSKSNSQNSVNSIDESKVFVPSTPLGGSINVGSLSGPGGSVVGGAAAGVAIHYMSRRRSKGNKKYKSKFRHSHTSSEHTKNASKSKWDKHSKKRSGDADGKKHNGRYRG